MTEIKICGITEIDTLATLAETAVHFAGFVCVPRSSRFLPVEKAAHLAARTSPAIKRVALFADAADDTIDAYLAKMPVEFLQLHGKETPARASEIHARFKKPIIKAIALSTADDLKQIKEYENICNWLLFDAKAGDGMQSGGAGQSFDWNLLAGKKFARPWMLAGGLNSENITQALGKLSPDAVDVSSGVEISLGQKDNDKIRKFVTAVKSHCDST